MTKIQFNDNDDDDIVKQRDALEMKKMKSFNTKRKIEE